jgi:hypothetical protein
MLRLGIKENQPEEGQRQHKHEELMRDSEAWQQIYQSQGHWRM